MLNSTEDSFPDSTNREMEIISLCKENYSCKEIAEKLYISEKTVRKHRQNILSKIGGKGKIELRRFIRTFKLK